MKRQDLLENEKNGRNAFPRGAKIHFSEQKYFGIRGTLSTEQDRNRFLFQKVKQLIVIFCLMSNVSAWLANGEVDYLNEA